MLTSWLLAYVAAGAFVGFIAGMLGSPCGGGMTLVPILAALFTAQAPSPDHTVHLALATAMASAFFASTATACVREHHRHGAVDWTLRKKKASGRVSRGLNRTNNWHGEE